MPHLSLGDLLDHFPTNDLARALVRAGLPGQGTKIERLERLRAAALKSGSQAGDVLALFSSDALRRVACRLGIRDTRKDSIVAGLVGSLTEPFPPPQRRLAGTLGSVRDFVRSLSGSRRTIGSETDAEWFVASALADHFDAVETQVIVPGNLGHRIDIDILRGRIGVEVKLAEAVVSSSSEAYRLLGQAFYYDRRRYAGRLLVVVVGAEGLRSHPVILELVDLLTALGVAAEYLTVA